MERAEFRRPAKPTVGEVLDRAARCAERADVSAPDIVAADRAAREEQLHHRTDR